MSLPDLFDGRRQLIVYRAFYGPEVTTYAEGGSYPERACVGCSFVADQVAHPAHLNARDTTLAFASRAPQAEIQGLKERLGWDMIPWYTITDDFDTDFGVRDWHGTNAFIRDDDGIFRTYFVDSRGDEHHGHHLELPRYHRARAPGGVGGLARGLPADAALWVVELSRRVPGTARLLAGRGGVIAHIGGLPLEEILPSAGGAGAGLLVARAWIMVRLRRRREPRA